MSVQDRKTREFDRRGQEILAAALTLFRSDDWESVTVDEIARQAEVGKGTIYKHFASKDEIYAHLAMDFQRGILARFTEIDSTLPVMERFHLHLKAAWDMHLSSKELHRVFLFCSRTEFRSRLTSETLIQLQHIEQQVASPTHRLVEEGISQGIFANKPLPILLFGPQAAFWGAIQLVWSGYLGENDQAAQLDSLATFILAGLIYHDRELIWMSDRTVSERLAGVSTSRAIA